MQPFHWFWMNPLTAAGTIHMALDEALLTWVQQHPQTPQLIVRTYQWERPTLSLGVHQKGRAEENAMQQYKGVENITVVRRPTGGRAILHGQDVSFAFVTNVPQFLKLSLDDSYCLFSTWVRHALETLDVPLAPACTPNKRDYMRSAICFETTTPSDLMTYTGQKVAGSAQLRRNGGILQHGAAFLKPFNTSAEAFNTALYTVLSKATQNQPVETFHPEAHPDFMAILERHQQAVCEESETLLSKLATTSGSHLDPASA